MPLAVPALAFRDLNGGTTVCVQREGSCTKVAAAAQEAATTTEPHKIHSVG